MSKVFDKKILLTSALIAFVSSFMLFIYEPFTMYANNIDDFWFDFYVMISPSLVAFLICFAIVFTTILLVLFLIRRTFTKTDDTQKYILIFSFMLLCFYIHGNFLTGFLPSLDGTIVEWNNVGGYISSIIVFLFCIVCIFICCKKYKNSLLSKINIFLPLCIFTLLSVSLVTTFATTPIFEKKNILAASLAKNINDASTDENFMILLVDAVDSIKFNAIVDTNADYQNVFADFSYYPDTMAGYAFTRDSIPLILSGQWNTNEENFSSYSTNALTNSTFLKTAFDLNYNVNLYDTSLVWRDDSAFEVSNMTTIDRSVVIRTFVHNELRYATFKYMPYFLKFTSNIDYLDFDTAQQRYGEEFYEWSDYNFYNNYLDNSVEKTSQKYLQYIHIEGAHVPFNIDENIEYLSSNNGTYEQKLECTMKIIQKYIQRLKDNGVYDNSTIIIMADHGYGDDDNAFKRQNPILYIKGKDETHDKMLVSDKQISYADLNDAFIDLLDGQDSTEIFANVPTTGRVRRYLNNQFNAEYHMDEYEQTGKAWDTTTLKETGRSFDL